MGLFDRWRAPGRDATQGSGSSTRSRVADVHDTDTDLDDVVAAHLARLTAAAEGSPDTLGPQEFEAALTSRLVATSDLPWGDRRYQYISPFAPHISEVLTLDLPMAVVTLPEERLTVGRHAVPSLVSIGRRNLERLMAATEVEVRPLGDRRGATVALVSDSPYTGSFARFLAEAVARFLPQADTGNGVVFAVPDRHAIVLSTCSSPAETRAALETVPVEARTHYASGAGPVSPHVYHWYHRELTCLTTETLDGTLELETTPLLDNMLGSAGRRAG